MPGSGKEYLEMFDAGKTYSEIGEHFRVSRNNVAARIWEYRQEQGLKPRYTQDQVGEKFFFKKKITRRTNGMAVYDKELHDLRMQNLKMAKRRPDGVLECPPMFALGYKREV